MDALEQLAESVIETGSVNGVEIKLRPMSIQLALKLESATSEGADHNITLVRDVVADSLVEDDPELLNRIGLANLMELFSEVCRISGMSEKAQEESVKNSSGRQS